MKRGMSYTRYYSLDQPDVFGVGCECKTHTKTPTGYKIMRRTNFISTYRTVLTINGDGTAKSVTKVDKNYHPKYQFTLYFDEAGLEIVGETTREELLEYKRIRRKLSGGTT